MFVILVEVATKGFEAEVRSGVTFGRVLLPKLGRSIFRQVAEAVTPHLLSGSSLSSQEFRFRLCIVKNAGLGQTAFEAGSWLVFSVQTGIAGLATQIFDNLVGRRSKFVRTLSQTEAIEPVESVSFQ